jgi:hypothetical protein
VIPLSLKVPEVNTISSGAAAIGGFLLLLLGWYGARWWIAEQDEISARKRLATAVKVLAEAGTSRRERAEGGPR